MSADDEADLWRGLEKKDEREAAFRRIYDRYSSVLLRYVFRFCPDQAQAEDILHDVFAELLAGRFRADEEGASLKGWLFAVAKNKALNRRCKGAREIRSDAALESAADPHDLEAQTGDGQILKLVQEIETTLPSELRETWALRREGLDYQQIASRLAIPLGTVKSRFHRLASYFRKELNHEPK